ncbi:MAG: alkaline phosphatase family protein [Atribacterota bacterium]|nr:alkaline phosphatase family protein [Atribacterota bacterium]MDD4896587.1 alkaline phosphatase family protein [Atribacterota bacterium]MDD5637308.1 alkaline phosphatase family protein [Atribacterota bacterium]
MFFSAIPKQMQKYKQGQVFFLRIHERICSCFFIFFMVLFFFLPSVVYSEATPKFLIIHLDAIPSRYFFQYMEDGYLPNVKAVFENGHMIQYGLSLFPGGTETIYPRLKEGLGNETGESVGWGYYDREKERVVSDLKTFSHLFSSLPRRARASFIYGIPWLDTFMFLPMVNVPQLLATYGVIELIWFATDATGHALSEKIYLDSIKRFDSYFGKLLKRLNMEEINLILYCDHGMSFDNEININHVPEIKRVVGEGLNAFLFPNIYLKDVNLKEYYAQKIVQETEIDLAFYQENENPGRVTGYSVSSKVIFEENTEGQIRYLFKGEDFFNYYKNGYQGEWLTDSEWLSLTSNSKFPGVPPNIFRLLSNKNAGDLVIVVNPPKIIHTKLRYSANHHGVTDTDLLVPILLRGKELEHLYEREEMWLHTLFASIPALSFANIEPKRESNTFSFWGSVSEEYSPGFEVSLSPAYRWNFALRYEQDIYKGWFEYDVYSSYVIRLWTGAGLQYQYEENNFEPFLNARLQMDFGKIQFNYGGQVNFNNLKDWQENRKEIIYRINDQLSFNWQIPNRFGFTLQW